VTARKFSRYGLLARIVIIKLAATFFAVYVYGRITTLGDSERYLAAPLIFNVDTLLNRTHATDFFYAALKALLSHDILVHLFVSLLVGIAIWIVFRPVYAYLDRGKFWIAFFLPHFLIWTGVVGKEPLAVIFFLIVVRACAQLAVLSRTNLFLLGFGLIGGLLLRPHYGLAYSWLLMVTMIYRASDTFHTPKFNANVHLVFLVLGAITSILIIVMTQSAWEDLFILALRVTEWYFLAYDAESNRHNIDWSSVEDFVRNLWWGAPTGFIGPLPAEALRRPILWPVMLEGMLSLLMMSYLFYFTIVVFRNQQKYRGIIIYGFIPAFFLAVLIHYPFGIFNPGSAIRYKQALVPLVLFYPLLLMAEFRRAESRAVVLRPI
jgi:hypothetical protein